MDTSHTAERTLPRPDSPLSLRHFSTCLSNPFPARHWPSLDFSHACTFPDTQLPQPLEAFSGQYSTVVRTSFSSQPVQETMRFKTVSTFTSTPSRTWLDFHFPSESQHFTSKITTTYFSKFCFRINPAMTPFTALQVSGTPVTLSNCFWIAVQQLTCICAYDLKFYFSEIKAAQGAYTVFAEPGWPPSGVINPSSYYVYRFPQQTEAWRRGYHREPALNFEELPRHIQLDFCWHLRAFSPQVLLTAQELLAALRFIFLLLFFKLI